MLTEHICEALGSARYELIEDADAPYYGEVLRDDLAALGWTQCEAAEQ